MKLLNFSTTGEEARLGFKFADRIVDARGPAVQEMFGPATAQSLPATVDAYLAGTDRQQTDLRRVIAAAEVLAHAKAGVHAEGDVIFHPPVLRPGKVIAAGRNFRSHVSELQALHATPEKGSVSARSSEPAVPTGFVKVWSSLIGHRQPIRVPSWISDVDYEGELVVVIGSQADGVRKEDALTHIAGYTIANDVSARKLQAAEREAGGGPMAAKNPRTFGPMGPYLVTLDEIPDPMCMRVWSRVNGELRQDALTTDMIHDVKALVAWYSQIGLDRGDMIMCGTPAGVGHARGDSFLRHGDIVTCGVDGIGVLENPVVSA